MSTLPIRRSLHQQNGCLQLVLLCASDGGPLTFRRTASGRARPRQIEGPAIEGHSRRARRQQPGRIAARRRCGGDQVAAQGMRAGPSHGPRPMGARGRAHRTAARPAARPARVLAAAPSRHTADPRPASLLDLGSASRRTAKRCHRAKRGKGSGSDLDSRVAGATIIQVQGGGGPPLLSSQFRTSPRPFGRSVVRPPQPFDV